jgi:hypothetical protein
MKTAWMFPGSFLKETIFWRIFLCLFGNGLLTISLERATKFSHLYNTTEGISP